MSFVLWTTDIEELPERLVVKRSDSELFEELWSAGLLTGAPVSVVRLSENASEPWIVQMYLDYLAGIAPGSEISGRPAAAEQFMTIWRLFVTACRRGDIAGVKELGSEVIRRAPALLTKTHLLVELFKKYVDLFGYVSRASVFENTDRFDRLDVHVRTARQSIEERLADFKATIRNKFPVAVPFELVMNRVDRLAKSVGNALGTGRHADFAYGMSAINLAIATGASDNKHFQTAVLGAYRALDYYFFSLLIDDGLARFKLNGLPTYKFPNGTDDGTRVYMFESAKRLDPALSTDDMQFVERLNTRRNDLSLTHGLCSTSIKECQLLLSQTRELIQRKELDSTRYLSLLDGFRAQFPFNEGMLFAVHAELATYFEDIPLDRQQAV